MAQGLGVDLSERRLAGGAGNAASAWPGRAGRVSRNRIGLTPVQGQFDLIVSNPPYIAADEMADLPPEVRDWEPHLALTPGGDGLEAYRVIARGAPAHLDAGRAADGGDRADPGGRGDERFSRGRAVQTSRVLRDLDGRDRVVAAADSMRRGADPRSTSAHNMRFLGYTPVCAIFTCQPDIRMVRPSA